MKTVCVYHSIDLDDWMSAAIVKRWWITTINQDNFEINIRNNGLAAIDNNSELDADTIDFIGYNYGQSIPNLSEYDKVIMCDISFPKEEMRKLFDYNELIWIDHHNSAIKDNWEILDETEVLRDTKFAACELTWQYFFPNESMPEIVRLLGRYDCFGHKGTDEEQKITEFQYGARSNISNYEEAYNHLVQCTRTHESEYWRLQAQFVVDYILEQGRNVHKYLQVEAVQAYKNGFPIILHWKEDKDISNWSAKFICINKERFNAINFGIDYHKDGYDGQACFHYADGKWCFSLYSQTVDCSEIASQFEYNGIKGGGHKGAAGFMVADINQIIK